MPVKRSTRSVSRNDNLFVMKLTYSFNALDISTSVIRIKYHFTTFNHNCKQMQNVNKKPEVLSCRWYPDGSFRACERRAAEREKIEPSGAVSGRCRKRMELSGARSGRSRSGTRVGSGDYRNRFERG